MFKNICDLLLQKEHAHFEITITTTDFGGSLVGPGRLNKVCPNLRDSVEISPLFMRI